MITPRQLKELYNQGKNISSFLREKYQSKYNNEEIIEISYDLQAGSYIASLENDEKAKYVKCYTHEIAREILLLCNPDSVLEAGVGEATTLSGVLKNLPKTIKSFGFDLSWSRTRYARNWLKKQGLSDTILCTGSLFNIPFPNDSIDVVYTSHSIEPNGGQEQPVLRELYRVAKKFLVVLEPCYELANEKAKRRMESHGYCRNLKDLSEELGYHVIKHELFPFTANPLNPTSIMIIRKDHQYYPSSPVLACPRYKTPLLSIGGSLFSDEALMVYPIIGGIPCLRIENGILATKYEEIQLD